MDAEAEGCGVVKQAVGKKLLEDGKGAFGDFRMCRKLAVRDGNPNGRVRHFFASQFGRSVVQEVRVTVSHAKRLSRLVFNARGHRDAVAFRRDLLHWGS